MRFQTICLSISLVLIFSAAALAETDVEKGTRIQKMNNDRPVFEKIKNKATLTIYDSSGKVRFKKSLIMGTYAQNMNTDNLVEKYITTFLSPADDKGNSYLMYHYKNRPDVKWAYLRGIPKPKKVTGDDKKLSFFGSDFSNSEMGKPNFTEWKYRYLGDAKETYHGKEVDCYMVEALPKDVETMRNHGCAKRIFYFEKKTITTIRMDFFDENLIKMKELRLQSFVIKKNILNQNVYYETGLRMKSLKTGTWSELHMYDLKTEAEANLRTDIFTEQYLTQKWW